MTAYRVLHNHLFFISIIVLFRVLLDWCYFNIVSPYFSYSGFKDYSNSDSLIVSWVILLVSFIFINKIIYFQKDRPSNLIIFILYFISFIPFTVGINAGIVSEGLILDYCLYWFILLLLQRLALGFPLRHTSNFVFGNVAINDNFVKKIGFFLAVVVIYISGSYTGFRFHFALTDVYDLRLQARGYNLPTVLSYLFAWSKAITPFLLGYCIVKKKHIMAGFYLLIQTLNFGVDGMRSTFFMPIFVIIGVYFFKNNSTPFKEKKYLITGLLIVTLISIIEFKILNTYYIASLFVRRVMFIPILLHEQYYDFFSTHEPDYFRSSFLRHLGFSSPYTDGITLTIGRIYTGNVNANSNNGLVSDALANLGMYGIIIMPIIIVIMLRFLDKSSFGIDKRIILPLIIWYSYSINNTLFFTVLLTHGMLVLMFLMSFLKPEKYKQ